MADGYTGTSLIAFIPQHRLVFGRPLIDDSPAFHPLTRLVDRVPRLLVRAPSTFRVDRRFPERPRGEGTRCITLVHCHAQRAVYQPK